MKPSFIVSLAVPAALAAFSGAQATEGGVSVYPNGAENFMVGTLPPPGLYGLVYATHYRATRVNDDGGHDLKIPGFKVEVNMVAGRIAWLPGARLLGGDLVVHAIAPVVDMQVDTPAGSQHKTGLADLTTGIGLGWHHSAHLHSVAALDLYLPVGGYSKTDIANIGKNHWAIEPVYAVGWIDPAGFNGDFRAGYIFNRKNPDTGYRSGQEFHLDYAAGWGVGGGWTVGVGGYVYQQTTDDTLAGATVPNNRARAFAIGPSVKYDSGRGWFTTLKWEAETGVRNRAQGNSLWLKAAFPL